MRPRNIKPSDSDYYTKPDPYFGDSTGKYHGAIAKHMGLEGEPVKERQFNLLLEGCDLNGRRCIKPGRDKQNNPHHRAGIDIPLSAPKSVSITALHLNDRRLVKAHKAAVKETAEFLEKNLIYARTSKNGQTRHIKTGWALMASFVHSPSRTGEPHLHSHLVILNMTPAPEKRGLCAISNEAIYKEQKLISEVYNAVLAKRTKDLGYDLDVDPVTGRWEIKGFTQKHLKAFSSRSEQIRNKEKELAKGKFQNASPAKRKAMAAIDTRQSKKVWKKRELRARWQAIIPASELARSIPKTKKIQNRQKSPQALLNQIFQDNNGKAFTKNDILRQALKQARGELTVKNLDQAFSTAIRSKQIKYVSKSKDYGQAAYRTNTIKTMRLNPKINTNNLTNQLAKTLRGRHPFKNLTAKKEPEITPVGTLIKLRDDKEPEI